MTQEGLVTAVIDFVTFPVDYYNSLLCGITDCNINRLQQIEIDAVSIATNTRKLLTTYKPIHGIIPVYMCELVYIIKSSGKLDQIR